MVAWYIHACYSYDPPGSSGDLDSDDFDSADMVFADCCSLAYLETVDCCSLADLYSLVDWDNFADVDVSADLGDFAELEDHVCYNLYLDHPVCHKVCLIHLADYNFDL